MTRQWRGAARNRQQMKSQAALRGIDEGGNQLTGVVLFFSSLFFSSPSPPLAHELLWKLSMVSVSKQGEGHFPKCEQDLS